MYIIFKNHSPPPLIFEYFSPDVGIISTNLIQIELHVQFTTLTFNILYKSDLRISVAEITKENIRIVHSNLAGFNINIFLILMMLMMDQLEVPFFV